MRTGFGRTALVAAASTAALLATAGVGGQAGAQDAPPTSAAPYIDAGTAKAAATVVAVAPATGSLELAITSGQALAETSGGLAAALAQSFNLGLIGSSLTGEGCDGGDPTLRPDQLPQASKVDNRAGPAAIDVTEIPVSADGLGAGREVVSADMVPSSRAESTTLDVDLGLVTVGGGRSTATATVHPGDGREATAGVQMDLTIAGLLELRGLRWSAHHRTGSEPVADGAFELVGMSAAGIPIPFTDLGAVEGLANTVLLPLGLEIELPRFEHLTEPVDIVRVTPLRIRVADSPLGALGVRPALDLTRDLRSQLFDALVALDCSTSSVLLIADIVIGVTSGTGSLLVELGGVEASTARVEIEDVFGTTVPPDTADLEGAPPPPHAGGPVPTVPGVTPPATVARPATPVAPGVRPAASLGPGSRHCESTHPNRAPACSSGALGVVGGVGIAATAAAGVLDLRRRRVAAP